jgi:chromate transporter
MSGALEVFLVFLRLGLTSFGGPVAHLGYFREAFVVRRKWIDEAGYADLVALCQFLPGPASSQVGFALGLKRAGALGGLAAFIGFTAPSALIMLAVANGVSFFATPTGEAIAHGLKLVAVAIVAHAVVGMAHIQCKTWTTRILAVLSLVAILIAQTSVIAPLLILIAGSIGMIAWVRRADETTPDPQISLQVKSWIGGASALLVLGVFLSFGPPTVLDPLTQLGAVMARTGLLVFGGGHAVLPLMESDIVDSGWMSAADFLAGYGAAQALPGPLFSFAGYVGAVVAGPLGWLIAILAIFTPGLLLVAAILPFWDRLKNWRHAAGFVRGAGAAVVGVLAAALYDPVFTSAVRGWPDLAVAAAGFAMLQWAKAPAWAVVLVVGGAGAGLVLASIGGPVH